MALINASSEGEGHHTILVLTLAVLGLSVGSQAETIIFGGLVTQSTQDGTGPAVNNPALNPIATGDSYTVTLGFPGSITAPGTYNLTGSLLSFQDSSAPATENNFGLISLTIGPDGTFDDISLLGCLLSGSGCFVGNQLAVNFKIPSAQLNAQNVTAQAIPNLVPSLDLLEDDGVTDIQASLTTYSYTGASSTPEPSTLTLVGTVMVLLGLIRKKSPARLGPRFALQQKGTD
jgi:hypothetical protein